MIKKLYIQNVILRMSKYCIWIEGLFGILSFHPFALLNTCQQLLDKALHLILPSVLRARPGPHPVKLTVDEGGGV